MAVSIKKFNSTLNTSMDIDQKFTRWKSYRSKVTSMMEKGIMSASKAKSVLVFGAGECNDLDLPFMLQYFEKIVLTDVDQDSILKGIKHQNVLEAYKSGQILVREIEYSGLSKLMFFETLLDRLEKGEPVEGIKSFIQDIQKQLEQADEALLKNEQYDFVLSSAVYTQLVYSQVQVLIQRIRQQRVYPQKELVEILEVLLDLMPFILRRYNLGLLQVLKPEGRIMCITDVLEDRIEGEFLKPIREKINDSNAVDNFYECYIKENGYGLGSYGLSNLQTLVKTQIEQWAIWPFDVEREFLVHFFIGTH